MFVSPKPSVLQSPQVGLPASHLVCKGGGGPQTYQTSFGDVAGSDDLRGSNLCRCMLYDWLQHRNVLGHILVHCEIHCLTMLWGCVNACEELLIHIGVTKRG